MKMLIVSVCVNYLDYLSFCFEKNKKALSQHYYYIITDTKDTATQNFCKDNDINCFITDEFYSNYCAFNKGRAINSFFKLSDIYNKDFEYILLLDSDCVIDNLTDPRGSNILDIFINLPDKDPNCLYSCGRRIYNNVEQYNKRIFNQGGCNHIGFFQLFHRSNFFQNQRYLLEYRNASVYDCELAKVFTSKKCLSTDVDHIGPIYMNWDGRHPHSKKWE